MNEEYISKLEDMYLSDDIVNRSLTTVINSLSDEFGTGDLSVNGKFEQTNDPECVVYASEKNSNSFVQVDSNKGETVIGTKGWCILSIALEDSFVKLSGDATELSDYEGTKTTIRIGEFSYNGIFEISSSIEPGEDSNTISIELGEDGNTIVPLRGLNAKLRDAYRYFVNTPENIQRYNSLSTEEACLELFDKGANMFYLPEHPLVGNQDAMYSGQIATGSGNQSIESYTHAEGKGTMADGSYSHAEGEGCRAFGLASHAEGISCTTTGTASHAEGYYCSASGNHSFAKGLSSQANGHCSFAFGQSLTAGGEDSMVLGLLAKTKDDCSFVWNPGEWVHPTGEYSPQSYRKTYDSQNWGTFCINPVGGSNGVYIGNQTLEEIIQGQHTDAKIGRLVVGSNAYVDVWSSLAGGTNVSAYGYNSLVYGENLTSNNTATIGLGKNALISNDCSFVWNASPDNQGYNSKGWGTFCVNPAAGTGGFWIGGKTLQNHMNDSADSRINNKLTSDFGKAASGGAKASGHCSIARGSVQTSSLNSYSTVIGLSSMVSGYNAFINGQQISVYGNYSVAFGQNIYNGLNSGRSFVQGENLSTTCPYNFIAGKYAKSDYKNSFVWSGRDNKNYVYQSQGENTFNICPGKDPTEDPTEKFFIGEKNFKTRVNDLIESQVTSYVPRGSNDVSSLVVGGKSGVAPTSTDGGIRQNIVLGTQLSSSSFHTTVFGINAIAKRHNQFVWSGDTRSGLSPYGENLTSDINQGSFCINPWKGLSGFFIGEKNFISCVIDVIKANPDIIRAALNIT